MKQKGPRLGEPASLWRMRFVPIASVMFASALPLMLPLIANSPVLPPLGLLFFLCWQLLRAEMWPVWIGLPLGLWDDLFSGAPIGTAMGLWTVASIAIAYSSQRIYWRGFFHDWAIAAASPLVLRLGLLAGMALVAYLSPLVLGPWAHGTESFVLGVALLLLAPWAGLLTLVAGAGAAVVIALADPTPTSSLAYTAAYTAVGSLLVPAIVAGLGMLARLVEQIHDARADVGRVAVARERVRVARDVHDLLGLGISAITLRCELADRLLEVDPERARAEIAGVLDTVQDALGDVRTVVGGDRELSLEEEWRSVVGTLEAAAVEVRTGLRCPTAR